MGNANPTPTLRATLPYDQLYGEWTDKSCEQYVQVFRNTLLVAEELIGRKFPTRLVLTNQSDVETMHLTQPSEGKRLPEFPELLGIWKQKEMSGVLQIRYDYKYDDVQPYEGYARLEAGGKEEGGEYHVTIALYNHALNLLTYIDSEATNLADDNNMPPHIAKKTNVVRKTEAFLRKSAESNGITFEGSRDMFGWKCFEDGWCEYERTPPQNMETIAPLEHESDQTEEGWERGMRKRYHLRSWGTDENDVVDSGTCIAWSLLIADEMNEKGITGKKWSEEFHKQHKTAESAQMYISHAITRDMVRCQRATMKSVKGGGEQVSNRHIADFLKDRVLQHEATAGRDVALRRNVNRLLQYSKQ